MQFSVLCSVARKHRTSNKLSRSERQVFVLERCVTLFFAQRGRRTRLIAKLHNSPWLAWPCQDPALSITCSDVELYSVRRGEGDWKCYDVTLVNPLHGWKLRNQPQGCSKLSKLWENCEIISQLNFLNEAEDQPRVKPKTQDPNFQCDVILIFNMIQQKHCDRTQQHVLRRTTKSVGSLTLLIGTEGSCIWRNRALG